MSKIEVSKKGDKWVVEYPASFKWHPNVINVYDTFDAAQQRARDLEQVVYGCADATREDVASCVLDHFRKGLPKPTKASARSGRGSMVAVKRPNGGFDMINRSKLRSRVARNK